jgi:hypothetical protein
MDEYYELEDGEPCCDLNADGKAFGHQDIQTDA